LTHVSTFPWKAPAPPRLSSRRDPKRAPSTWLPKKANRPVSSRALRHGEERSHLLHLESLFHAKSPSFGSKAERERKTSLLPFQALFLSVTPAGTPFDTSGTPIDISGTPITATELPSARPEWSSTHAELLLFHTIPLRAPSRSSWLRGPTCLKAHVSGPCGMTVWRCRRWLRSST
ncbi:MAG: hypothetical protein JWP27_802, partial [Flaviaesturariibacter sp.]|nr:hypothetical protein [Flaviaesturariibacter sp.]